MNSLAWSDMAATCSQRDCTVAQTGKCMLNNEPSTCPNHLSTATTHVSTAGLAPVLSAPDEGVALESSMTLGGEDVRFLLERRLCTQVGILGFPDAGKTAALVSLYLLVSSGNLEGFEFRDCRTLMAFEQISRGARAWDRDLLPDQVTAHTEISDGRTAGFLHLKLFDSEFQRDIEFFVPDLPGEWTTTLVDQNRGDRLEFLRAADILWLFMNGHQLTNTETRGLAVHRAELMINRTSALLGDGIRPPLALVVTRRDEGVAHQGSIDSILQCAIKNGFDASIVEVASFSKFPNVAPAGTGLVKLIKTLRPRVDGGRKVLMDDRRPNARYSMNFRKL